MKKIHQIGIECRDCGDHWKLSIPLSGNKVDVFATMCPCGAIIVGNYNSIVTTKEQKGMRVMNDAISKDEIYLANGNFNILDISEDQLKNLPELDLE